MSVHQSIHRCTRITIAKDKLDVSGRPTYILELVIEQDDSSPTHITLFSEEPLDLEEIDDE